MEITLLTQNHTLVVSLCGELDHHSASEVRQAADEAILNKGIKHMIFDFSRLEFMDSSGIGMLVGRFKLVSSLGGNMAITCPSPAVERLLTMSGIKKIIAVHQTTKSAMEFLQEEAVS